MPRANLWVYLICRVATHSNEEGDVSRASPWAFPGLLELFPNVFNTGRFRRVTLTKGLVVED